MKHQIKDFWNNKVNSPQGGLWVFIIAIILDAGSMLGNELMKDEYWKRLICFGFTQEQRNLVYFLGQSSSRLFYIFTIQILGEYIVYLLSQIRHVNHPLNWRFDFNIVKVERLFFVFNLIAIAWVFFALSDTIEEIIGTNEHLDNWEIIFFGISLGVVILKVQKHYKENK